MRWSAPTVKSKLPVPATLPLLAIWIGLSFANTTGASSITVTSIVVVVDTVVTSLSLSVTRTAKLSPALVSPAPATVCAKFWVRV